MKILITAPSLDPLKNVSGISSIVSNIMTNKKHNYYHFVVGRTDFEKKNFVWIIKQFGVIFNFFRLIYKNNFDLFHLNFPMANSAIIRDYFLIKLAKLKKIKTITHVHGGYHLMSKNSNLLIKYLVKNILNNSNVIIVLSYIEKNNIIKKFNYKKDIIVLPNCVNTEIIYIKKKKTEKLNILYVGRLDKEKGLFDIVQALSKIDDIDFCFLICGAGPLEDEILKMCDNYINGKYSFEGIVSGGEKNDIFSDSDIFILPSYYEGLPMSLLETMSAGVVPIVTNVGSISTVVDDGLDGIFIDKNSPEQIADKIRLLYNDRELLKRMSENARNKIIKNYGVENYLKKLNEIYESV
jgi:glycosyltransferase involved in cell wall biosynthesis